MSSVTTLLRQLEANVQEETGAQRRLLELLGAQDMALRSHAALSISETTRALEAPLESAERRTNARRAILASLASAWNVSADALTLSSIATRAGEDGERLRRQRDELERVTRSVQKLARRNGTVARFHQRLTADVLQAVLASDADAPVADGGTLVDAEA
jgi:hypothetical protein